MTTETCEESRLEKIFFTLVMLISGPYGIAMTSLPGFSNRDACDSAGSSWLLEAKKESRVRYICFGHPERNGTR